MAVGESLRYSPTLMKMSFIDEQDKKHTQKEYFFFVCIYVFGAMKKKYQCIFHWSFGINNNKKSIFFFFFSCFSFLIDLMFDWMFSMMKKETKKKRKTKRAFLIHFVIGSLRLNKKRTSFKQSIWFLISQTRPQKSDKISLLRKKPSPHHSIMKVEGDGEGNLGVTG